MRDALAAFRRRVQGMAPQLMLLGRQQAVSHLIGRAGMAQKGAGNLQAVGDLLQHLTDALGATERSAQQAGQLLGIQRSPALLVAFEIRRTNVMAAPQLTGTVDSYHQPASGQAKADATSVGLAQAHRQVLCLIVQAGFVARQCIFTQIAIEQALDGMALGFTVEGMVLQGQGINSDCHAGISREVINRGRAITMAAKAARHATRNGEAIPQA